MKQLFIVLFQCFLSLLYSQDDPCKFFVKPIVPDSIKAIAINKRIQHSIQSTFNFSALKLENVTSTKSQAYQIALSSDMNSKTELLFNPCYIHFELGDVSGFNWIPDSSFLIDKDQARVKMSIQPAGKKKFNMNFNSLAQSQKFRTFLSSTDSLGQTNKNQNSGFLSPGAFFFNGGFIYNANSRNKLELGLASIKLNCLINRNLYSIQNTNEIAGIPKDKAYTLAGGLNFQSVLEKNLGNLITWENSSLWFYPISKEGTLEVQIKNALIWKPISNLQACFRTNYSYNEKRWPPGLWSAEFTLGLAFNHGP